MKRIYLTGELVPEVTQTVVQSIHEAIDAEEEINLSINSPGGSLIDAFGLYDLLRTAPVWVTTEVVGSCASAAVVVFLAGDDRIISPNSVLMLHAPIVQATTSSFMAAEAARKEYDVYLDIMDSVFSARSIETDEVRMALQAMIRSETYEILKSDKAMAFGLANQLRGYNGDKRKGSPSKGSGVRKRNRKKVE